jgi:hypothetical protein
VIPVWRNQPHVSVLRCDLCALCSHTMLQNSGSAKAIVMRETTHHYPGSLPRTTVMLVRTLRPRAHVLIPVTPILLHTSGIAGKPIWPYGGPAWLRTLYIYFVSDCTIRELVLPLGVFLPGHVPCTVIVVIRGRSGRRRLHSEPSRIIYKQQASALNHK